MDVNDTRCKKSSVAVACYYGIMGQMNDNRFRPFF